LPWRCRQGRARRPPVSGPVGPLNIDEAFLTRRLAIELTVVLEDWGRVQRIFEIPT
jgi:hypothetical protein